MRIFLREKKRFSFSRLFVASVWSELTTSARSNRFLAKLTSHSRFSLTSVLLLLADLSSIIEKWSPLLPNKKSKKRKCEKRESEVWTNSQTRKCFEMFFYFPSIFNWRIFRFTPWRWCSWSRVLLAAHFSSEAAVGDALTSRLSSREKIQHQSPYMVMHYASYFHHHKYSNAHKVDQLRRALKHVCSFSLKMNLKIKRFVRCHLKNEDKKCWLEDQLGGNWKW